DRVASRRLAALPWHTPGALDRLPPPGPAGDYPAACTSSPEPYETEAITAPPIDGVKRSSRSSPDDSLGGPAQLDDAYAPAHTRRVSRSGRDIDGEDGLYRRCGFAGPGDE